MAIRSLRRTTTKQTAVAYHGDRDEPRSERYVTTSFSSIVCGSQYYDGYCTALHLGVDRCARSYEPRVRLLYWGPLKPAQVSRLD